MGSCAPLDGGGWNGQELDAEVPPRCRSLALNGFTSAELVWVVFDNGKQYGFTINLKFCQLSQQSAAAFRFSLIKAVIVEIFLSRFIML